MPDTVRAVHVCDHALQGQEERRALILPWSHLLGWQRIARRSQEWVLLPGEQTSVHWDTFLRGNGLIPSNFSSIRRVAIFLQNKEQGLALRLSLRKGMHDVLPWQREHGG